MLMSYSVWVNGDEVYSGSIRGAEETYTENLKWIAEAGEVISLRDQDDMTVKKVSISEEGKTIIW